MDELTVGLSNVGDEKLGEDVDLPGVRSVFPPLKLKFTTEEKETLDLIKSVVETEVVTEFMPAFLLIKAFAAKTRIPDTDGEGKVRMDNGNIIWKKNPDGSLDIWIGRQDPGGDKTSNWLPAPANGPFTISLRAYLAKAELLDGRWRVPALVAA